MDEKVVKNDDRSSVGSPDESSIFSSRDGTSLGSQSSTDGRLLLVDELVDLLVNDRILKLLYRVAIDDQAIGGDVFEATFRQLLESCSEELEKEAHQPFQNYVVELLRSRAAYMSKEVRALHDPGYDEKEKLQTQRSEWLRHAIVEVEEKLRASQSIEQEPEPDGDFLDVQDLMILKEFLLSSFTFQNLRTNFKQRMLPAETTALFPDVPQQTDSTQNEDLSGICAKTDYLGSLRFYKALSLQVTRMQTLYNLTRSALADLGSFLWSWELTLSESYMRRREPFINRDKVRIRWRCRCGRKLWDDFRELRPGAAEDLRRCLHFNESTISAQETNEQQTPSSCSLGGNGNVAVARTPVSSYAGASGHSSAAAAAAAESSVVATEPPSSTSPAPDPKFLLLCFKKPGDTLRLYHLNVEDIKTDFQLFHLLQQRYRAYQGQLGRFFSPRKIKSIVFRKLERHPRERVVILSCPDIVPRRINPGVCHQDHVPKCDTEYDIDPVSPDLDPYIGHNGLEHLLNHPHEAEEQGNNLPIQDVWLKRFPKKEKSKLTVCPPYQYGLGWGIEFDETWNFSWVLKGMLIGCVLAATVFLVCWWSVRGDVQGATGMAALLVSYCVLLITLFSACAIA